MQPTGVLENSKATKNPLKELLNYGQSMWLDYIRRDLFTTGKLKQLIADDGLRGMTSNPAIFEKAIADSSLYDDMLKSLASRKDLDTTGRYEQIAIRDIQDAADILRPVYDESNCRDGYVSLEVSPYLALKTQETIDEARRLWKTVKRDNVMIKVPGTAEGLPAIRQLIGEGLNINITLLFSQEVYEKVAEAYIAGLEDLAARGGNLKKMASVASFFISRIDTLVDSMLNDRIKNTSDASQQALLKGLLGKVAIANGKLTYQRYQKIFSGPRWQALAAKGAQTQRVLWASTSTKNPALSRRDLRRRIDWTRHRRHDAAGDDRCLPRSWTSSQQSHRRCDRRRQSDGRPETRGHLDQGSDRQADRRTVSSCLPTRSTNCWRPWRKARSKKDRS